MFHGLRTLVLLALLNALLFGVGYFFNGETGLIFAIVIAFVLNFSMYFYSDKIALAAYKAVPLSQDEYPEIYEIVTELSSRANIPMPKLWLVKSDMANAFATGRNPEHASVAVTTGILSILTKDELRAVLAHELAHVVNRDILITTIAAVVAAGISILADIIRMKVYWGGSSRDKKDSFWGLMLAVIFAPMIAALLQLAISRTREYSADETGCQLSSSPLELASALQKLQDYSASGRSPEMKDSYVNNALAPLFFTSPFKVKKTKTWGSWFAEFFSTHPDINSRINKLTNMAAKIRK